MVTPDGMPLVWLLHRSGYRAADRVCGPDLMPAVFRHSQGHGVPPLSLRFFRDNAFVTAGKASVAISQARELQAVTRRRTALTREEEREVDRVVNAADPDIVWVGLGAPKQDRWMAAHRRTLKAPVLIGVGAAFDMLAGTVRRTPCFLQRTGFEWMFRLAQEPRRPRERYLESNSKFAMMLIGEKVASDKASGGCLTNR